MRTGLRFAFAGLIVAAPIASGAQLPRSLSGRDFGALVVRFSEPSGYFDTDNVISNEDSYLHPISALRRLGVTGGVYVGVGPDQNFSYIAAVRPHAAVIIDIRRDNLLEHLLFKSIFALSRNRMEFLSFLFGRTAPSDTAGWGARSVDSLLANLLRAPPADIGRLVARARTELRQSGVALSDGDFDTIHRFHTMFISRGPGLRFTSFGRPPSAGYPDYGQLVAERDLQGRQRSFLATEEAFQFVKSLEDRNLLIPVVGNFAGPKAFAQVGRWMAANNEKLSALYASNVEQYLIRDGGFDAFAANVERLPRDAKSVIIRSCFNACRGGHSHAVGNYYSVQMVQLVDTFAVLTKARRIQSYYDLVSVGLIPP
jgi:hypothetical protein